MKGIKTINPLRKNARTLRKEMTWPDGIFGMTF